MKKKSKPVWDDGELDGYTTTPEVLVPQLVGDRVFPGAPDEDIELRTRFEISGSDEDYLDRAKALFKALLAAITKLHGKPESASARNKSWERDGREIHLWLVPNANPGDVQIAEVRLRSRPLTTP
jgi:hypothetical protein